MREIRYRAYYKPDNRMIYNIQDEFEERIELGMDCFANYLNNDDFIVEQDTGLKDKNSRAIWEGDIVLIDMWDGDKRVPEVGYIIYDQSFAGFMWLSADDVGRYTLYDLDYPIREVIGNIHNNPELLEK